MGYESKLYIVEKSRGSLPEDMGKKWAKVIACYDLSVCLWVAEMFTQPTDCYIYGDDGDTAILEDMYGKPLTEASVESVIKCIESMSEELRTYRRIPPLLALLKAFEEDKTIWESLAVLHFGH